MPPALNGAFGSGVSPIVADSLVVLVRNETKNSRIRALDVTTAARLLSVAPRLTNGGAYYFCLP
jgi:hypothetical protein